MMHSRLLLRRAVAAALVGVLGFCCSDLRAAPSFTPLGDLSGGSFSSQADAVSADGNVVVGRSTSTLGQEAFRWVRGVGMSGLGDLSGGAFSSSAHDVSADGSVVVGTATGNTNQRAFRWTQATGLVPIDPPAAGDSVGNAVSADGSVVVGSMNTSDGMRAFRWTSGTGPVSLGAFTPSSGTASSFGHGVSADGSVVTGASTRANINENEAFRWTQALGMVGLGDLAGGSFNSSGVNVSPDGDTIVGTGNSGGNTQAMRWTQADGMVPLGFYDGTDFPSSARAARDDGFLAVGSAGSGVFAGLDFAVIYDTPYGLRDLKTVLTNEYGLGPQLMGWTLRNASDITPDGQTIVGQGINPSGNVEAFIITLPEPGGLTMGLLFATMLRRRRR